MPDTNVTLAVLLIADRSVSVHYAVAGQAPRGRVRYRYSQSAIKIASTPPPNSTEHGLRHRSRPTTSLVGTIRLGDPLPCHLSPVLQRVQLWCARHGVFPDHRTYRGVSANWFECGELHRYRDQ